ncbi:uncharacterized protein L969DRAFT_51542 [Mixia osmundae IAM 14324]|uniref:NAD-specific glutamate dehydrogenase n=1 Tax=Mixia osmundae (strain CBS 9802 / IAM 14324 / JCM 22182 / KY 12970) TaxID=764103 RepID=G7DWZ6_MIXOS|nr:uncharacterized protein L969DRAFT_51542 [Mixia osmundae IAM 14324]KEI38098.1 hypothetical protein L969DRAFT_51542 [Mixia osmundae IAM 14324]GAA95093.1 hypothetical protein E5Q_01748 [Mixia osmundae IAM 14324]
MSTSATASASMNGMPAMTIKPSLSPGLNHLSVPGTPHRVVSNSSGYHQSVFKAADKKLQATRVEELVREKGFIPEALVHSEVSWYTQDLGIDDAYFKTESVETIASHIISLYGSKILAYARGDGTLDINLEKIHDDGAVFIHTSNPGVSDPHGPLIEQRIDEKYLDVSTPKEAYRLETYRSAGHVSSSISQQLRCYFLARCNFVEPNPDAEETDITKLGDRAFLETVSENTLEIYQEVMLATLERTGPVVEAFDVENSQEKRLVIGYRMGSTSHFFSAISDLYHWYGIYSSRKYVEHFSNGVSIVSLYLNPLRGPPINQAILQITREISLIFCLPSNPFFVAGSGHAVQESSYAYAAAVFCQHFLNRLGPSFLNLKNQLDENDPTQANILADIRKRLREQTFTRQSIRDSIEAYPELVRLLYVNFAMTHYISGRSQLMPTLSYQRIQTNAALNDEELYTRIKKTTQNAHDFEVFESMLSFNKSILKTNFYQPTKVSLSFRLDPAFLPEAEYPTRPYGLILVVGPDFRGFHVRFSDVARGGIRIIRSRDRETFSVNQRNLFDENYALALTQHLKNKDIPEGGSKGTILPDLGADPRAVFEKYIDSILDLLIPGNSPGVKEQIVDLYQKEEILFFGPDENTAGFMDWACLHARERGYGTWKSITTGKSSLLGGVAHDIFGMTSLSVRQYVIGIYQQLGLREEEITKMQTGGPDGDLGSNEILLSKDKTIAIIDGSGVLHDPSGLNREELTRLAKERKMVTHFDRSLLSSEGYLVLVEDQDFTLPSGEIVNDGTSFRNSAHLRYKADIFVPCGGRPESINMGNIKQLFDADGKPNFKYVVEGANLFISPQARLALEKRGVVVFKDASANKGGVTSSSLEVLSGLGLDDQEFLELMTNNGHEGFSEFYRNYVQEIQKIISYNAAQEFNCIWKDHAISKKPRPNITDELSRAIVQLQADLEQSNLWDDLGVRRAVISRAVPKTLLKQVGLDKLISRLPPTYLRSLFADFVASHYVYEYGLQSSLVAFYSFVSKFKEAQA